MFQQLKDVSVEDLEDLVFSKLKKSITLVELQDLTKIEIGVLFKVLKQLMDKGMVKFEWERQTYKQS